MRKINIDCMHTALSRRDEEEDEGRRRPRFSSIDAPFVLRTRLGDCQRERDSHDTSTIMSTNDNYDTWDSLWSVELTCSIRHCDREDSCNSHSPCPRMDHCLDNRAHHQILPNHTYSSDRCHLRTHLQRSHSSRQHVPGFVDHPDDVSFSGGGSAHGCFSPEANIP